MFLNFETEYAKQVERIINNGVHKEGRNGGTRSIFGISLEIDMSTGHMPIIQGRKSHYKGVLGEFAALLRRPHSVADFEAWGCNYWKKWADENGDLVLDYGNAWFNYNGVDQIAELKKSLRDNPNDRRMIVNAWRPDRLKDLSLPCCHYSYQFNVENNKLNMIWTQRSADMMIGVPADMILAAVWLITLANEFGFELGRIKMDLGDCHVYDEHLDNAIIYLERVLGGDYKTGWSYPSYKLLSPKRMDFCRFAPDDLHVQPYDTLGHLEFELKE